MKCIIWRTVLQRNSTRTIIGLYFTPPYNVAELKKGLDAYGFDEKTKASILDAVTKNIDEAKNPKPKPRRPSPARRQPAAGHLFLFPPRDSDLTTIRTREDAAVRSLAGFDLGFISEKDAGDWAVLRLTETEGSGIRVLGDRNEKGFATVGKWERIASLIPSPGAERAGKYFWATSETAEFQHYWPLNDGGFILAQHYPKKIGKEQFGTIVVLSEDTAKWVAAAYQFREERRSFWEAARRAAALEAPGRRKSDDRHHGRTAACRAHSDRLTGKALGAARRSGPPPPGGCRVPRILGRGEDTPFDDAKNGRDARPAGTRVGHQEGGCEEAAPIRRGNQRGGSPEGFDGQCQGRDEAVPGAGRHAKARPETVHGTK